MVVFHRNEAAKLQRTRLYTWQRMYQALTNELAVMAAWTQVRILRAECAVLRIIVGVTARRERRQVDGAGWAASQRAS
jgi:hypothetical protein